MQTSIRIGESLAILLLAGLAVGYGLGWRRLHRAMPALATPLRLLVFALSLIALGLALVWPLPGWSNYLLAMRSLQKALICMVAAPLFWLACPIHVIRWGMRDWPIRDRSGHQSGGIKTHWWRWLLHKFTQPLFTWFFYVAAFLFWHDPSIAQFALGSNWTHTAAPWLLLAAALLFWWPVVDAGPRFHRTFPTWLFIIYLLSVEIANMIAGITIAFSPEPLYPYYPALRAQLRPDLLPLSQTTDQVMGGAIVWVFGSFVYISAIISVLHRLFRQDGSTRPQPLPNWDDSDKFIAPGLEHRVAENQLRKVDLGHH
jgi:cytochrome c oxidase assembly factor CtaG